MLISGLTRHLRLPLAAAAACATALGLSPSAQSATQNCDKLAGRQVLKTDSIRIVSKPFNRINRKGATRTIGRDYLACARPRGTVRRVGQQYRVYLGTGSIKGQTAVESGLPTFGQNAGRFVIVLMRDANLAGDYEEQSYKVVDVASGKGYRYFHFERSPAGFKREPGPPSVVKLDDQGRLAAIITNPNTEPDPEDEIYSEPAQGQARVVAFNSAGKRQVLDTAPVAQIPRSSLTLRDGVVGWTNAGQPKSATLATASPSASASARTSRCRGASKARGVEKILARSSEGVVFQRSFDRIYGCVYANRRLRRLDVCCDLQAFRMAGHFAAYDYRGSAIGDESDKLGVYNLRTGKLLRVSKLSPNSEGAGQEIDTSSTVPAFLVTSKGALIWLQAVRVCPPGRVTLPACDLGPGHELRAVDGANRSERIVDSGNIDTGSLKLSKDERTISWTKDGAARSEQVRRR